MLTTFDIIQNGKLNFDNETQNRLQSYQDYRALYDGDFNKVFSSTILKIRKRYPLDNTTAQTLIELNLFSVLTDFFKELLTNSGLCVNVPEKENLQDTWDEIAEENQLISVVKEVFIDNSRFGNGLFKVSLVDGKVKIFSICPDCWHPVFNNGNLNDISGHLLIYPLQKTINGTVKEYRHFEKHHKGYIENEVYEYANNCIRRKLDDSELEEFGLSVVDDFSQIWEDFIIFPVKNTTVSDKYFGCSDYKKCISVVEELMLTVSQNSKIINRHANPKLAGSEQNLEHNPVTNERQFPNTDFIKVGTDGVKPEYITANLQADAIEKHINTLLQFFYMITKTPPQAYGLDIAGNMSGESLRKIFMSALSKCDDIKQVSLTSTIQKVVKCAMAFNKTPVDSVGIDWGEPIPQDTSEKTQNVNDRVSAGTKSKISAIMELDNVNKQDAQLELTRIIQDQRDSSLTDLNDLTMKPEDEE